MVPLNTLATWRIVWTLQHFILVRWRQQQQGENARYAYTNGLYFYRDEDMKKLLPALMLWLSTFPAFSADAPTASTPIKQYHATTEFAITLCKLSVQAENARAIIGTLSSVDGYEKCISDAKTTAKESLVKALETIKAPSAIEAMKTYHVAFVTALEGVRPGQGERKISYENRQIMLEGKMTGAWARFEIEE